MQSVETSWARPEFVVTAVEKDQSKPDVTMWSLCAVCTRFSQKSLHGHLGGGIQKEEEKKKLLLETVATDKCIVTCEREKGGQLKEKENPSGAKRPPSSV